MQRQFYVKAYKSGSGAFYGTAGTTIAVYCNHIAEGTYGMNAAGETVPTKGAALVPGGPSVAVPAEIVPKDTSFPNTTQPNLSLINVTLIKDMVTMESYYVDTADYNTNKINCNPVSGGTGSCPPVGGLTYTSTNAVWSAVPGVAGYEYVTDTASAGTPVFPTTPGTYLPPSTTTYPRNHAPVTPGQANWFFVRTICPGGVLGDWNCLFIIDMP